MSKGALALISAYGGDSSDDEVPGCRVSTKRVHKYEDDEPKSKRLERLPVPNFTVESKQDLDDPSLHDGKIRSFPHERGNWATFVYIPFEFNGGLQFFMQRLLEKVPGCINLKAMDDFHISLTKTVILKYHWIDSFVSTIRENISHFYKFVIIFSSVNVYSNEDKTRTFVSLDIQTGYDSLLKLVGSLDRCLAEFKLPEFYENPSFHMSLAWCVGNHEQVLKLLLPELNCYLQNIMSQFPQENWLIFVEHLLCKTGNKLFQFGLR